jgi:hypothetical protein
LHFGPDALGGFVTEEVVGAVEQVQVLLFGEDAFGVEFFELGGGGFGGGIAVLLEGQDGAAEASQGIGDADVLVGIDFAAGPGVELGKVAEEFASAEGGELEAGFGQLESVGAGQQAGEGFVAGAHFLVPKLVLEVVLVTAEFPFRDMVDGEAVAPGAKVVDEFLVGDAVVEPGVDFVAGDFGEEGDFAGATVPGASRAGLGSRRNLGRRGGSGA